MKEGIILGGTISLVLVVGAIHLVAYGLYRQPLFGVLAAAWILGASMNVAGLDTAFGRVEGGRLSCIVAIASALLATIAAQIARRGQISSKDIRQVLAAALLMVLWVIAGLAIDSEVAPADGGWILAPMALAGAAAWIGLGILLSRRPAVWCLMLLRAQVRDRASSTELPRAVGEALVRARLALVFGFFVIGAAQVAPLWLGGAHQMVLMAQVLGGVINGLGIVILILADTRDHNHTLRIRSMAEELGHISASVEHDLRNPISNLSKKLEVLRDRFQHEKKVSEAARYMERQLARIVATVDTIPAVREGEEYYRKRFTRWNLVDIVNSAARDLGTASNIAFSKFDIKKPTVAIHVDVYRERILQALINILTNGVEAYGSGPLPTPVLVLRVAEDAERGEAVVSIRDSGGGIPDEAREHITEPLFSTKNLEEKANRGLGLFIARKIIEQHRGRLEIESDGSSFTEVTVRLPLAEKGS